MSWTKLSIPGCYQTEIPLFRDDRGSLFKTLNISLVQKISPVFEAAEAFTTVSGKNVLRGMHYQRPPDDHNKLVTISSGRAHDVLVDLRPGAQFGKICTVDMVAGKTGTMIFVAKGVAHGFLSLTPDCTMNYVTDTEHSPQNDRGVLWSSIGHEWPVTRPVLSSRDQSHPPIETLRA